MGHGQPKRHQPIPRRCPHAARHIDGQAEAVLLLRDLNIRTWLLFTDLSGRVLNSSNSSYVRWAERLLGRPSSSLSTSPQSKQGWS